MWAAQKDVEYAFKVVIVGAGGVGKTCLFNRYCFNSFNMNTSMTVGINFHSTYLKIQMEDKEYHPPEQEKFVANSIFDMSGQDKFKPLIINAPKLNWLTEKKYPGYSKLQGPNRKLRSDK